MNKQIEKNIQSIIESFQEPVIISISTMNGTIVSQNSLMREVNQFQKSSIFHCLSQTLSEELTE